MNKEKVAKWNEKVDYNKTTFSWIVDIFACIIFFPYLIIIVYRRGKYNKHIEINDDFLN